MSKRALPLSGLAISALLLPGCFLIPNEVETAGGDQATQEAQTTKIKEEKAFSHALWDELLQDHNKGGFVDYAAIKKDSSKLDNYLALLAKYSPQNARDLFKTEDDELAYWINAYNALVFKNVLRRMGQDFVSVYPDRKEFFYADRFEVGGEFVSLQTIEKDYVLKTFQDPRVHFALNCASFSCPRLPEAAFTGEALNKRLDEETRAFLSEERNVQVDEKQGKLILSKLFDWYGSDFRDWPEFKEVKDAKDEAAKVVAYINRYRAEDKKIPAREGGWTLEYRKYNWRYNARGQESGEPPVYAD